MAKWPIVGAVNTLVSNGVQIFAAFGGLATETTEAIVQQEVRDTYTASNLRVYVSLKAGNDSAVTFRLNAGDGNQTVPITGTGEFEDTSNTDNLVSGNLICANLNAVGGMHGDNFQVQSLQTTLDASTNVPPIMGAGQWNASSDFAALQGLFDDQATEADAEYTMRATRVLRDLRVYASIHTGGSDPAITIRKNRSNTSLTVTVNATGEFTDFSNTASFVAGDEANYGAGAVLTPPRLSVRSVEADTSSGVQMYFDTLVASAATFFPPSGQFDTSIEARVQIEAEDDATIQNLFVNCFTYAETRTIRTRKNASNGAVSVSVSGTGLFEDLSNTDSLAAEDDLSIQQDAGSSGNNGYLIAVEWETSVSGAQTITASGIASLEAFGSTLVKDEQPITASGIASLEAFGSASVAFVATPSGIASLEAFGSAQLDLAFTASGIASTEAFGAITITVDIPATGIASLETFGSTTVANVQIITGAGIASLEAFGSAQLNLAFTASGIASAEAFGSATVVYTPQTITGAGIASTEAFGGATISTTVGITAGAIASAEAFGGATITTSISFTADGIASTEAFGAATVDTAAAQILTPDGIASAEAFGAITITLDIPATGIASAETFGSASVAFVVTPAGIASLEAFGSAAITTTVGFTADGIASAEAFGSASVLFVISPSGIASLEAFGTVTITVDIPATGIASAETFGSATVANVQIVTGAGIASLEAFGTVTITIDIPATGIASAETFGAATLSTTVSFTADGIASLEAFGSASVVLVVTGAGIASAETFGTITITLDIPAAGIVSLEAFGSASVALIQVVTGAGIASLEAFGAATITTVGFSFYGEWRSQINPDDYPASAELFFEAVLATSNAGFPSYARLYNITDGAFVADSQVSSVNTTSERVRSGALSLPAADKEYRVQRGGFAGATYKCFSADVGVKSS